MYNSKLIEHLQALDKSELKELEKFIRSPFFVEGKAQEYVFLLFQFLKNHHPQFTREAISPEQAYEALFPTKLFVKGKVEKIMSQLLKLVRQFIVYQNAELQNNEFNYWLNLCNFYRERQMETSYKLAIGQLEKMLAGIKRKSKKDYLHQLLLDQQVLAFESLHNERKGDLNLPATLRSLDQYYLAAKLEYAYWIMSQNNSLIPLDVQDKLSDLFSLLPNIEQSPFKDIPLIQVYYRAILFLQDQDNSLVFEQFRQSLETHQEMIPLVSLKALQTLVRIYYIRQFNRGRGEYLEQTYELYCHHLEQGYLFYDGGLLLSTVRNLTAIGLKLKKYDWVRQFLETYKNKIVDARYPKEVYHFNLANYYFAIRAFDEALTCLADTYEDSYYKIAAKRLELKIYYEQESNLFELKMEAFKIYLHRISNKLLPDLQRVGNNNFINMLLQIVHPKTAHHKARINKLINKVRESNGIAEKEWLLEKLEEKKKRSS